MRYQLPCPRAGVQVRHSKAATNLPSTTSRDHRPPARHSFQPAGVSASTPANPPRPRRTFPRSMPPRSRKAPGPTVTPTRSNPEPFRDAAPQRYAHWPPVPRWRGWSLKGDRGWILHLRIQNSASCRCMALTTPPAPPEAPSRHAGLHVRGGSSRTSIRRP